jgi:hypothetical protein
VTAPGLQPLAMGELIDRSVSFWRARVKPLFQLYVPFELALYGVTKAATLLGQKSMPFASGRRLTEALQDTEHLPQLARQAALAAAGLAAIFLVDLWVGWWVGVAGTRYCVQAITGEAATLGDGLRTALRRTGRITVAFLLSLFQWGVAGILCALPGAGLAFLGYRAVINGGTRGTVALVGGMLLIAFGAVIATLWYILRFMVTAQVLASEDIGGLAALRRSNALVSGRIGPGFVELVKVRATILLTVILLIRLVVQVMAGIPGMIIAVAYGKNGLTDLPQGLLIPAELISTLAEAAFGPLFLTFTAFFYLDMRVRREGLDLQLRLAGSASRVAA